MKCPKCQYISFDQGGRCRNCGYEFSLSVDPVDLDLPLRTGDEPVGPLSDFSLAESQEAARPRDRDAQPMRGASPHASRSSELPLFRDRSNDDDAPLVSLPASPRPPVAVRKSTVNPVAPARGSAAEPGLDLEPEAPRGRRPAVPASPSDEEQTASSDTASAGARLLGGVVDLLILGAIDGAVLFFTLRLCGLELAEIRRIPVVPFAAFLALLNGGYVTAFTAAGGQSIGKMAAHIKVVTMDESGWSDRVRLGQAVLRASAYLVSALPLGLGFLPALVGPERRAVHDRLAHTRVVKA
ncbi:MAG: RDD family protein [Acidobacteria bacterium]|nr:RDD family protein [Acidobacteriota bacterium]